MDSGSVTEGSSEDMLPSRSILSLENDAETILYQLLFYAEDTVHAGQIISQHASGTTYLRPLRPV